MKKLFRIATRGSPLALWQAEFVQARLQAEHADLDVRLVRFKTQGDKILDAPLAKIGGKGLFVKELEEALLQGDADLAVHSMKDVPAELPAGLVIGCTVEREDPRDALVTRNDRSWETLPLGARVGTSSLRRRSQLLAMRPDLRIVTLRGNVGTRLAKMESLGLDAVLLAAAGLNRMGLAHRITKLFAPEEILPAIGQGALGIEVRAEDQDTRQRIAFLNHTPTAIAVRAERAFLGTLEGGCQVPVAAIARLEHDLLSVTGLVAELDGSAVIRREARGRPGEAESIGKALGEAVLDAGGRQILKRILALGETDTGGSMP